MACSFASRSVKELKRDLTQRGIPLTGLCEKSELVDALRSAVAAGSSASGASGPPPGGGGDDGGSGGAGGGEGEQRDGGKAKLCAKCGGRGALICGRCMAASYCDAACQRSDWNIHKARCVPAKERGAARGAGDLEVRLGA